MKEEAALAAIETWDAKGRIFLPARAAGDALPDEVFRWADVRDRIHLAGGIHVAEHIDGETGGEGGGDDGATDREAVAKILAELNAALDVDPIEAANDRATGEDVRKAK